MEDAGFPRIPVHVLSGFLGVGKTTAVRDLLRRRADRERVAVVVNEFGDLGVDGALLSDCASCILKEVPGGCVCCTAMGDLEASLEEMLGIVEPTRIVVEPTGLARPSELVDLLRSVRWAPRLELRPVVTLVDPRQDLRALYAEGGLFRDQVDVGDFFVVNRCDEAGEEAIRAAELFAKELVPPKLAVVRTSFGVLPDEVLETPLPSGRAAAAPTLLHERRDHDGVVEGHKGRGFLWEAGRVFDADRLEDLVRRLSAGDFDLAGRVARAKGIFHTTAGWRVHEIAGGTPSRGTTVYRRDSRFDAILKDAAAGDFEAVAAALEEALVPDGAPLLTVEDEAGLIRAFDTRALAARFGSETRLAEVLRLAGAPAAAPWLWLVSDGGLFGTGGPRAVLEKGLVEFGRDGSPIADEEGGPFRFRLPDEAARGAEDEVDLCRDVPALCGVRLARRPGEEAPP